MYVKQANKHTCGCKEADSPSLRPPAPRKPCRASAPGWPAPEFFGSLRRADPVNFCFWRWNLPPGINSGSLSPSGSSSLFPADLEGRGVAFLGTGAEATRPSLRFLYPRTLALGRDVVGSSTVGRRTGSSAALAESEVVGESKLVFLDEAEESERTIVPSARRRIGIPSRPLASALLRLRLSSAAVSAVGLRIDLGALGLGANAAANKEGSSRDGPASSSSCVFSAGSGLGSSSCFCVCFCVCFCFFGAT